MPLLVHAVCRPLPADAGSEDDIAPLEQVEQGGLVALASVTDQLEPLPTRRNLLHHTRVLEQLADHVTVAPMRFPTTFSDAAQLQRELLEAYAASLHATLERLDGRVELRLVGRYDEEVALADVARGDRSIAGSAKRASTQQRIALGERVVAGLDRLRQADAAQVRSTLEPRVVELVDGPVHGPLDAFRLSLLIPADDVTDLRDAIDRMAADLPGRLSLELVGPVAPLSFVDAVSPEPA